MWSWCLFFWFEVLEGDESGKGKADPNGEDCGGGEHGEQVDVKWLLHAFTLIHVSPACNNYFQLFFFLFNFISKIPLIRRLFGFFVTWHADTIGGIMPALGN